MPSGRIGLLEMHDQIDIGDEVRARVVTHVHDDGLGIRIDLDINIVRFDDFDAVYVEHARQGYPDLLRRLARLDVLRRRSHGLVDREIVQVNGDQLETEYSHKAD